MLTFRRLFPVLVLALPLWATNAVASPIALRIQSGATTISISDNGAVVLPGVNAADQNATIGEVAWSGNINGWNINIGLGLGSQFTGTVEDMDLTYNVLSGNSPAPLTMWLTEVNVPAGIPLFNANTGGSNHQTSTEYTASYDAGNGYFTAGTLIAQSGIMSGQGVYNYNGTGPGNMAGVFSVTQKIVISAFGKVAAGSRLATGDMELVGVPVSESSTLLMLGSALAALAMIYRKRPALALRATR